VVLETVEIFVSFAAVFTSVRFMHLHAESAWVTIQGHGINNGIGTILIGGEFLCVVAML